MAAAFVSRRRSIKAEIDWLGRGGTLSAADYREAMTAKQTERDVQRASVDHLRRALPRGSRVFAIPNQRSLPGMDERTRHKVLAALVADGMEPGASDLVVMWDRRLGAPGNQGVAVVEFKRPRGAKPPTVKQLLFQEDLRNQGKVAGIAKSLEDVEDLLIEAGAPLLFRLPRVVRPASDTPKPEGAPRPAGRSAPRHHRGEATRCRPETSK